MRTLIHKSHTASAGSLCAAGMLVLLAAPAFAQFDVVKSCYPVESFTAACDIVTGHLQAVATFSDPSFEGTTVLMGVGDIAHDVTVVGNQALLETQASDFITVELFQPTGLGCPRFFVDVFCAPAAGRYCEVTIDEITYDNCAEHDCRIRIGRYCTNRACNADAHCSGITRVVKRCGTDGVCIGTAVNPKTCTC